MITVNYQRPSPLDARLVKRGPPETLFVRFFHDCLNNIVDTVVNSLQYLKLLLLKI
jgi:hypothetical protein